MSFLHLSLLAGMAALTVPVMLHLFGQRQPQVIDFPALRFVRETTQEQSSSWRLRHLLLLLLRLLLLAALVFALARPRVHSTSVDSIFALSTVGFLAVLASIIAAVAYVSKRPSVVWMVAGGCALLLWGTCVFWGYRSLTVGPPVPTADQSSPIAAALIIDNGPTMSYRFGNESRLELAKEHALWVLDQLPVDSKVGVLGGAPVASLGLDPASAVGQVKQVRPRGAHVDLVSRIQTAVKLVEQTDLERKEVYIITDLTSASWQTAQTELADTLTELQGAVLVQIIDVGTEDQANWALGDAQLDFESVPVGGSVEIEVPVTRPAGDTYAGSVVVELMQEAIDPRLPVIRNGKMVVPASQIVDRQVVDLSSTENATIKLSANELEQGTHHFVVRIDKRDPLAVDNARYVSVVARPQQPTLILASEPELALSLQFIADPLGEANNGLLETGGYSKLSQGDLDQFQLIWMHDPPALPQAAVEKLYKWVESGGALLIVLGPGLGSPKSIRGNAIAKLLPGALTTITQRDPRVRDTIISPTTLSHPMFYDLGDRVEEQIWSSFAIFLNWEITSLSEQAQTIMEYSDNGLPAVVSEVVGSGNIMTFTTPVPHSEQRDRPLWNELWVGGEPVLAFGLLHGVIQSLYGASQESMNHQVGSPISLDNDERQWPTQYQLFLPEDTEQPPRRVSAKDGVLLVDDLESVGVYRLRSLRGDPLVRGFSINAKATDTDLTRVEPELLDDLLGSNNFRIAHNRDEVESSVGQARFGRELFPMLMLLVAGLFLAEQAMSNRFYKIKFRR